MTIHSYPLPPMSGGPDEEPTDASVASGDISGVHAFTGSLPDVTRMDTAVLVKPEEQARMTYWFAAWADDHEAQARAMTAQIHQLGPQLWSWEGTLISLWEARDHLEGLANKSMRERAMLKTVRAKIKQLEPQRNALSERIKALRSQAREHEAAAKQLRAQVLKMAREARQGGYWR